MSPYTDFFSEKAKEKDDKALEPPPETQLAGSTNWLSDITGLMCNTDLKKKKTIMTEQSLKETRVKFTLCAVLIHIFWTPLWRSLILLAQFCSV